MDHTVLPATNTMSALPRKRSPDGASTDWGAEHLIAAHYSFIDPERMKGWVGLVGWCVLMKSVVYLWILCLIGDTASQCYHWHLITARSPSPLTPSPPCLDWVLSHRACFTVRKCMCVYVGVLSSTAYVLYYCNTVGCTWLDWSLILRTLSSFSALTLLVLSFDW